MTSTITIHIIEEADGKLTVCTTAANPKPGERLSPGRALALDLLCECKHRATVQHWHGQDAALAFVLDLFNPEELGHADKPTIIAAASRAIGRPLGLGTPPAPQGAAA